MRYGALPVEYDNSLSYYEQLCRLTSKINDLIKVLDGDISAIVDQYLKDNYDKLIVGATYNEMTETIMLGAGGDVNV